MLSFYSCLTFCRRTAAIFIGITISALVLVQIPAIKTYLVQETLNRTLAPHKIKANITGVSGFIPFSLSVRGITIKDASKDLLTLKNFNLTLNTQALLNRQLSFSALSIDQLHVSSDIRNHFKTTDQPLNPHAINQNISQIVGFVIHQTLLSSISVKNITVHNPDGKATFTGHIAHDTTNGQTKTTLWDHGGKKPIALLSLAMAHTEKGIQYTLKAYDPGYFLDNQPIQMDSVFYSKDAPLLSDKQIYNIESLTITSDQKSHRISGQLYIKADTLTFDYTAQLGQNPAKPNGFESHGTLDILFPQNQIQLTSYLKNQAIDHFTAIIANPFQAPRLIKGEIWTDSKDMPFIQFSSEQGIGIDENSHEITGDFTLTQNQLPTIGSVNGVLQFDPKKAQGTAKIAADVYGIKNSLMGTIHLNTETFTTHGTLHTDLAAYANHLNTPAMPKAGQINVNFSLDHTQSGKINAIYTAPKTDMTLIPDAHLSITLKQNEGDFSFHCGGDPKKAHAHALNAHIIGKLSLTNKTAHIHKAGIEREHTSLTVDQPIIFDLTNITLPPSFSVHINSPTQKGKITWANEARQLTLHNIPLLIWRLWNPSFDISGNLNGSIQLKNAPSESLSWQNLNWDSALKLDQLQYQTNAPAQKKNNLMNALSWTIKLNKTDDQLSVDIANFANKNKLFTLTGSMKWADDFAHSPINMAIKGLIDISFITSLIATPDRIAGFLTLNLKVDGTLADPNLSGDILAKDGLYESFINGTHIANINGRIKASGKQLIIDHLRGNDGPIKDEIEGTVDFLGTADLNLDTIINPNIILRLANLSVVRRDDMSMRATGDIHLKGKGLNSKLTGSVVLDPSVILLDELTDDDITTILFRKNGVIQPTKKEIKMKQKHQKLLQDPLFPIDLALVAGDNFTLKGEKIQSQWTGTMHARGDFSDGPPYLIGHITLKDGFVSFFGKSLTLTKGSIIFDDWDENNPIIHLEGSKKIDGIKLIMHLNGRANDTEAKQKRLFTFTSDPPLTEDNVLSYLLFDKDIGSISEGQSVQLAAAGASLRGDGKNSLNILEKFRNAFGFDTFELKENQTKALESDTGKTASQALSVGKEFGKVKINVDQSLGNAGSKATISAPIAKDIYIDVDIGDKTAGSGAGLNWILHY